MVERVDDVVRAFGGTFQEGLFFPVEMLVMPFVDLLIRQLKITDLIPLHLVLPLNIVHEILRQLRAPQVYPFVIVFFHLL